MTVCLATGASITAEKRVVGIHYTLESEQYNDDFIVLDRDDKFDVILEFLAQEKRAKGELAASIREDTCHLFMT